MRCFDKRNVIGTHSGRLVDPCQLEPADLDIHEIAHSLALTNRFGGHTAVPYSVAQHSCMVSDHCGPGALTRLAGLLHDATEAYLSDVVTPIKRREGMAWYREQEAALAAVVSARWHLEHADWSTVERIDREAMVAEAIWLFACRPAWVDGLPALPVRVRAWDWRRAEREFIDRFSNLSAILAGYREKPELS